MEKSIEIISMVYKSIDYLNLISSELKKSYCLVNGWNVTYRIVANDANPIVLEHLKNLDVPYSIYNDPKPADFYLNRVYRCWNYGGFTSQATNICFVNSDMVFSDNWLTNLLLYHDGINIPCSRLVESGKMPSATHGISKNFGKTPRTINFDSWYGYANSIKQNTVEPSGLFMPCVFEKARFIESGGYPEGNIYQDGKAGSMVGITTMPGDIYYFEKLRNEYGMKHITVFDSIVYHIQEGELDE